MEVATTSNLHILTAMRVRYGDRYILYQQAIDHITSGSNRYPWHYRSKIIRLLFREECCAIVRAVAREYCRLSRAILTSTNRLTASIETRQSLYRKVPHTTMNSHHPNQYAAPRPMKLMALPPQHGHDTDQKLILCCELLHNLGRSRPVSLETDQRHGIFAWRST